MNTGPLTFDEVTRITDIVDWITQHLPQVWWFGLVGSYAAGQRGPDVDLVLGIYHHNDSDGPDELIQQFAASLPQYKTPLARRLLVSELLGLSAGHQSEWLALDQLDPRLVSAGTGNDGLGVLSDQSRYALGLTRRHQQI